MCCCLSHKACRLWYYYWLKYILPHFRCCWFRATFFCGAVRCDRNNDCREQFGFVNSFDLIMKRGGAVIVSNCGTSRVSENNLHRCLHLNALALHNYNIVFKKIDCLQKSNCIECNQSEQTIKVWVWVLHDTQNADFRNPTQCVRILMGYMNTE